MVDHIEHHRRNVSSAIMLFSHLMFPIGAVYSLVSQHCPGGLIGLDDASLVRFRFLTKREIFLLGTFFRWVQVGTSSFWCITCLLLTIAFGLSGSVPD